MTKVYYDNDADLNLLEGTKVAIIGYGAQGRCQSLNLRDSGVEVIVSELPGTVNYQKAVEEMEDFLIGLRLNILFDPKQVRTAAKLLYHTRGQFRVAELADHCHLSMRQLQRQFDETTGVSPKALARAIRFESIRERLMFDPNANLTDLAYEFGYADQAHFIKDFKDFTDKTPGEFALEMQQLKNIFTKNENVVFLQSPPAMPDYNAGKL